jgi:hypothetical protein
MLLSIVAIGIYSPTALRLGLYLWARGDYVYVIRAKDG